MLERLFEDVAPKLQGVRGVRIDLAGVQEIDTIGAWLLEKMSRHAAQQGITAELVGVTERYAGLIDEVRQVNRSAPTPRPRGNVVLGWLDQLGRLDLGRAGRRSGVLADARRAGRRAARRAAPAALAAADLAGLPGLPGRLAGDPDHHADHLPDRRHHRAAGHLPFPQVRRGILRRRHGRHPGAARDRRPDRGDHGRRPLRQRLHRRARLDEDARGDRRAVAPWTSIRSKC